MFMGERGPTGGCALLVLALVAGLPLLAYLAGKGGIVGQLFGWLFN